MPANRLLKIFFHSLDLILAEGPATEFRFEKPINPFVVKRLEFERVFRRIQMGAEIVSGMSRQTRHDSRTRSTDRANN